MSQLATAVLPDAINVAAGAENADPNSTIVVVLKAKDESAELICSENMRSESSTPIKELVDEQLVVTEQLTGTAFNPSIFVHCISLVCM
jgi:hypothetical protein